MRRVRGRGLCLSLLVLVGCGGAPVAQGPVGAGGVAPAVPVSEHLLQELPGPRPLWVDRIPDSTGETLHFVGQSGLQSMERDARNDALRDAVNSFARYCGVDVTLVDEYLAVSVGKASQVADPTVSRKEQNRQSTEAFVSRVKSREWYGRQLERRMGPTVLERGWQAWVLVTVPPDEVAQVQAYRDRRRLAAAAERDAPHREAYARVAALLENARALDRDGKPLAALESYVEALARYEQAQAQTGFEQALAGIEAEGLPRSLPVEPELRQLLAALSLHGQPMTQRVVPGDVLALPFQLAVLRGGQPVAGAPVLFRGPETEVRATTAADGSAHFFPDGSSRWGEGTRVFEARLEHPALAKVPARFSVPQPVAFAVTVRELSPEEAQAVNRERLGLLATALAEAARREWAADGAVPLAVLPATEPEGAGALGETVGLELEAALLQQTGLAVIGGDRALRSLDSGLATSREAQGLVLSRLTRSGGQLVLAARLVRLAGPHVVASETTRLRLTDAFEVAAEARAARQPPLELDAGFWYLPPHGRLQPIEDGITLRSGHRYQVQFAPRQAAHVYAYQIDSAGTAYPLFPNADLLPVGNPVAAGRQVKLPAPDAYFELDDRVGTEELVVIASRFPLPEVERVLGALQQGQRLVERPGEAGSRDLVVESPQETFDLAMEILSNPALGTVRRVKFLHR